MYILRLLVPKDIDGRVFAEIFKPESAPARGPVIYEEVNERERIKNKISQLKAFGKT